MKKLLTLDDLVRFCDEQKLHKFSSEETGYSLRVSVPALFSIDNEGDEKSSILYAYIQVMHTGRNRNGSNLTESAAKEAMKNMAYKPLLANFCEIDGVKDFTQHDFIKTEDGEYIYEEFQVGCFTADEPYMKDDEKVKDRKNIFAKVAIPREYTDAAEIIERKGGTDVSVELAINSMSYDSKKKELIFESVEMLGCTCLGVDPDTGDKIDPGMEGAHIQLEDFSEANNSINFSLNEDLKSFIQASVDEALNKKFSRKEENTVGFDENVKPEEASEEELGTKIENSEDNALEAATVATESSEDDISTKVESEETENVTPDENSEEESSDNDNFAKLSVTIGGVTKEFSCSLIEKLNALYTLVNETYGESDNDYYDVDADDEKKEVYMSGWFSGKHYKQKYSVKKDTYSLQGDRVECFAKLLTADEIKQLESMRANYSDISDKLAKYEAEPEKVEVLNSEDYAQIKNTEQYAELSKREVYFELDKEDLVKKLDGILLDYAKSNKIEFSSEEQKKEVGMKKLPVNGRKKSGRYGSLFSK